jgi:hypothetical protein
MNDTGQHPRKVHFAERPVAVVHERVPMDALPDFFGRAFGTVMAATQAHGANPQVRFSRSTAEFPTLLTWRRDSPSPDISQTRTVWRAEPCLQPTRSTRAGSEVTDQTRAGAFTDFHDGGGSLVFVLVLSKHREHTPVRRHKPEPDSRILIDKQIERCFPCLCGALLG